MLDLLELRLHVMWATQLEHWEPNEFSARAVFLTVEPSLQPWQLTFARLILQLKSIYLLIYHLSRRCLLPEVKIIVKGYRKNPGLIRQLSKKQRSQPTLMAWV